jgi:hypothetical protein
MSRTWAVALAAGRRGRTARIAVVALLALLGACSRTVGLKVATVVPPPLVERHPFAVGVYYADDFRNHIFVENSEDRPSWRIETGSSQVALFNQLLSASFEKLIYMEHVFDGGTIVKGVIAPKVEEMQFATPRETLQDFYEAWIKYTVELYDDQGTLLTSWQTTAYGRARDTMLVSDQAGVDAALKLALRDAGAKFSIGFFRDPGVRLWLTKQ